MPPVYDFVCRTCGAKTTLDRRPETEMRHIKEDGTVCGTFRRDWSSINIDLSNCRAVPKGRS